MQRVYSKVFPGYVQGVARRERLPSSSWFGDAGLGFKISGLGLRQNGFQPLFFSGFNTGLHPEREKVSLVLYSGFNLWGQKLAAKTKW